MLTVPIRKKEDIEKFKNYFLKMEKYRDYTMFVVGINTALRISDLLRLKWKEIYDFKNGQYYSHLHVIEQKTKKCTYIAINGSCIEAFSLLKTRNMPISGEEYIFCSSKDRYQHIGRHRAFIIIKKAAQSINISENVSCHSLRKTFGYHAWKKGTPPALIMEIYNHSSIEVTKRYLSIIQDDKDEVFHSMNL